MESEQNGKRIQERRKFPRLNATVDIECSVIDKQFSPENKKKIKNISAAGICLIVYERVGVDDFLSLAIKLPESKDPLQVKGRVVWTEEFVVAGDIRNRWDAGIEFIGMSEEDRQKIAEYVFAIQR